MAGAGGRGGPHPRVSVPNSPLVANAASQLKAAVQSCQPGSGPDETVSGARAAARLCWSGQIWEWQLACHSAL